MRKLLENHFTRRQRLSVIGVAAAFGVILAIGVLKFSRGLPFASLDERLYETWANQRIRTMAPEDLGKAPDKIIIVVIDDDSLAALHLSWPIPRSLYPKIIARLKAIGAKTIGLDVLFMDPGPDPKADQSLARALGDPSVVIPYILTPGTTRFERRLPYTGLIEDWSAQEKVRKLGFTAFWRMGRHHWVPLEAMDTPRAKNRATEHRYSSFALAVYSHNSGVSPERILARLHLKPHPVWVGDVRARAWGIFINHAARGIQSARLTSSRGAFTFDRGLTVIGLKTLLTTPVAQLRSGIPPNCIALVGVTATGGHDIKHTVVGPISGMELQANALVNMILDNPMRELSIEKRALLPLLVALVVALLSSFLSYAGSATITLLMVLGLAWLNYYAYAGVDYQAGAVMLPFAAPATAAVVTQIAVSIYYHATAKSRMDRIVKLFQEVCPAHDVEALLAGQGLQLGGEERELTILFSDLRGYTSFAEKLDSVTVLNTLNEYFGTVGHIFERYGGLVFDYQGDAQMVVFGLLAASQPNHAAAACKAGAAMIATLNAMRVEWLKAGQNVPETGVGICTGQVSFGVLGTRQHKQYVAIGDPTNTASRVQGKSKELDAPVLVAESTARRAGNAVILEELDEIMVKGKREPLVVYRACIEEMIARGLVELDESVRRAGEDA